MSSKGRNQKPVPSVKYVFQMPGQIDEALKKKAVELKVEPSKLLQKMIADELGIKYY